MLLLAVSPLYDEAFNSIAYINSTGTEHHSDIAYPLLIVQNRPFTQAETKELKSLILNTGQEIIHLPNENPDISLLDADLDNWVVTDNSPLFYNSTGKSIPLTIWVVLGLVFIVGKKPLNLLRQS